MIWFIFMFAIGGILALCGVASARLGRWLTTRQSLKAASFIVLFCIINAPLAHHFSLQTIAAGSQSDSTDHFSRFWGYQLQYDKWADEAELSFSEGTDGLINMMTRDQRNLSYKYPSHWGAPAIKEERWLDDGTAIYLKFEVKLDNSYPQKMVVRFIHDFQRGQSFATRDTSRWLVDKSPPKPDETRLVIPLALSEEEFDEVLWGIEKRKE